MRIKINEFAKIKDADIKVDGITIIAGHNNTGKTTIGKVLYSVYNSLYDIDNQVEIKRKEAIKRTSREYIRNIRLYDTTNNKDEMIITRRRYSPSLEKQMTEFFADRILESDRSSFSKNDFIEILSETVGSNSLFKGKRIDPLIDDLFEKISRIASADRHRIALEIISRFFTNVFDGQIQSLRNKEDARVNLYIKNNNVSLVFRDNQCIEWNSDIDILHKAFFIDDPFVIDELNSDYYWTNRTYETRKDIIESIISNRVNTDKNDSLVETVLAKEKLSEVYSILMDIAPGQINAASNDSSWSMQSVYYNEPVLLNNLSAGLKAFVLLRLLLEQGIIKEKDVLILDEPEIHLHPEWQLKYAEIIVLLQKSFELNIIVTTHSQEFLEAIELFTKKHCVQNRCNYYLSVQNEGMAEFKDVTDNISEIYKALINPSRLLDRLRFELEDQEYE